MTIEEYIASQLDGSVTADRIEFLRFEGTPSKVWSELTFEDFSCNIHFRVRAKSSNVGYVLDYGEIDRTLYLSESDVINFLNQLFPDKE